MKTKAKKAASKPSFNQLWRGAQSAHGELEKFTRRLAVNVKAVRRWTYRFAKAAKELVESHHNEFLAMIASEQTTVDKWMDAHFELIESMGDTRERIFRAIAEGVTEREYVEQGTIVLARKRIGAPQKRTVADKEPAAPPASATPEEKLGHANALIESMRSDKQALRRELAQTRRDLAHALDRLTMLERDLKRAKKALDHATAKVA